MKNSILKWSLFSSLLAMICIFSCKKMETNLEPVDTISEYNVMGVTFRNNNAFSGEVPDQMMVLGNKIENPFRDNIIREAYQEIYNFDPGTLPVTDLYIRFLPAVLKN